MSALQKDFADWVFRGSFVQARANEALKVYAGPDVSLAEFMKVKSPETTRFKGLGEISPKEFGQFIGKDIRIMDITIENLSEVTRSLEFYMGKNTPERKNFIINNLISDIA
jgi:DNA gyrase/topoisomerase IV subunit B